MSRSGGLVKNIDWITIGLFLLLVAFGWMNVYGASFSFDQTSVFAFSYRSGKQMVWIGSALLMAGIILLLDSKIFDMSAYFLYAAMMLVLLITPFITKDVKGSLSWIIIGPVRLQPAEFAKCITALTLAKFMSQYDYHLRSWRDMLIPLGIIGIPVFIIMVLQKETGSALVFASFLLMFYREGMSGYVLLAGMAAVILFITVIKLGAVPLPLGTGDWGMFLAIIMILGVMLYFLAFEFGKKKPAWISLGCIVGVYLIGIIASFWLPINFNILSYVIFGGFAVAFALMAFFFNKVNMFLVVLFGLLSFGFCHACDYAFEHILQDHQRKRIEVLLGLKDDPQGAGYNVTQSLIAIGSGGFSGKGYLNGTQTKMNFVPEQATDFIFCTIGEEWGFLGSAALLVVYAIFILRLIYLAERQREMFAQIYAYCVVGIFIFHLAINIGMVLGLLPVIGIPLPFISYGGSGMWAFTIMLFILLRLDAARVNKM